MRATSPVKAFGAAGDGETDDSAAIAAALTGGRRVYFPTATAYRLASLVSIDLTSDRIIGFNGKTLLIDGGRLRLRGTTVATGRTLAANAARYATSVTLNSGADIAPGDPLHVNTSVSAETEWSYTKQDLIKVRAVSGADVELEQPLQFAYDTGDSGLSVADYRPARVTLLRPRLLRRSLPTGDAMVELIYVSTRPRRDPADGREAGETGAALVMVSGFARGDASLRLVEDFGRPEDGGRGAAASEPAVAPVAVAAEPPGHKRGRPPGSRSRPRAA